MHFMPDSDTGHLSLMHTRLKALHDSMRRRGASEAAIARLPPLPQMAARPADILPPIVLATRENGTRPNPSFRPIQRTKKPINLKAREHRRLVQKTMQEEWRAAGQKVVDALAYVSSTPKEKLVGNVDSNNGGGKRIGRLRGIGIIACLRFGLCTKSAAGIFGLERTAATHAQNKIDEWTDADPHLRQIRQLLDEMLGFASTEQREAA